MAIFAWGKEQLMDRIAYKKLIEWRNKPSEYRKPLILEGARQVGKTWLLEELGHEAFEIVAEINFEEQRRLVGLFEDDFDTNRILSAIQLATGTKLVPGKTLIILDEIQEAKRGVLALKYLLKNVPQYHIAAAGSLLGLSLHQGESFPVGKVEFLNLYPMSFAEFLLATGRKSLWETLQSLDWKLVAIFKNEYIEALRQYYFVGGMPEVLSEYVRHHDFIKTRQVQKDLLASYSKDFSKHPPVEEISRINLVWDNIPAQLAKENKKFIYGHLKKGSRAKDFESAISWLVNAGTIYKVTRINNASIPVRGFEDSNAFKLYTLDVGLLGAMAGLNPQTLLDGNTLFGQYKGALTEQYVLQQLRCMEDISVHYWSSDAGTAEVDFVIQRGGHIIPIEVKAEENLKAKSLKSYREKYRPALSLRFSMSDYREQEDLVNIPLYAVPMLPDILDYHIGR